MNKFALFTTIDLFGPSTVSAAFVGGHSAVTDRERRQEAQPCAVQIHRDPNEADYTPPPVLSTQTLEK